MSISKNGILSAARIVFLAIFVMTVPVEASLSRLPEVGSFGSTVLYGGTYLSGYPETSRVNASWSKHDLISAGFQVDGFLPTDSWLTLNYDDTNFYWIYDQNNSSWERFNFVSEGDAYYDANYMSLSEAVTGYPITITGGVQTILESAPMDAFSGLSFTFALWFNDSEGALQAGNFSYSVHDGPATTAPVPAPSSILLCLSGLGLLIFNRFRMHRAGRN